MMEYFKNMMLLVILLSLQACFTVKSMPNTDASCKLYTKELTLTVDDSEYYHYYSPQSTEDALIVLVGIPAVSYIVSGSIVVIGNVVHWVEKQGRCSNDTTQSFVKNETQTLIQEGGKSIQAADELKDWVEQQKEKED